MSQAHHTIKQVWLGLLMTAVMVGGFAGLSLSPSSAQADVAGANGNVSGYIWSSTIGWISLNCHQGGPTGASVCATSPYSVNIIPDTSTGTGLFDGYAWSSNIGWISFRAADVSACGAQASVNTTTGGTVTGWARALSGNPAATASTGGGWDGCISLSGTSPSYGVSYNPALTTNNLTGYSWGSTNVGWIDWSGATATLSTTAPLVTLLVNGSSTAALDTSGGAVALTWTTSNLSPADCTASNAWTGPKSSSGGSESDTVSANTTTSTVTDTYMITCTGTTGTTVSSTATVTVAGTNTAFLSFLVNGTGSVTVPSGSPVTLSWQTQSLRPGYCSGLSSGSFTGWGTGLSKKTESPDGTYTEVIPSVTTSRTYTMHGCMAIDGTPVPDQIVNVTVGTTTVTGTGTTGSGTGTATSPLKKPVWQEF